MYSPVSKLLSTRSDENDLWCGEHQNHLLSRFESGSEFAPPMCNSFLEAEGIVIIQATLTLVRPGPVKTWDLWLEYYKIGVQQRSIGENSNGLRSIPRYLKPHRKY